MTEIFLKFVNMGIAAGWLVLAVMLLRLALCRAPKGLTLVLWGIVALRLVLPVSIQSIFSKSLRFKVGSQFSTALSIR